MRYILKMQGRTAEVWGNAEYKSDDPETAQMIAGVVRILKPNDAEEVVNCLQKYYSAIVVRSANEPS